MSRPLAPVQYREGSVEFFGLTFGTDPRALIPRFETEQLVKTVIEYCQADSHRLWRIVEIGTGSGVIAVSLVHLLPNVRLTAIDISLAALGLARENAIRHDGGDRIRFLEGDLLAGFDDDIDIVVANLPYLPTERIPQLDASVKDHEPHQALDGGADGMDLYRRLFDQIAARTKKPELCVFEFDEGQEHIARREIAARLPDMKFELLKDTSGLYRYMILKTK